MRNKFMIALAVAACIASVSEACPFGRRKAKSCSAQVTYVPESKPTPDPLPVPEKKVAEAKPLPMTVQSCANGSCANQSFQVGPQRGIFFRWGR